jgi:hypothetical protein
MSYYTSLLASSCTRFSAWSLILVDKILKYLAAHRNEGIVITCVGDLLDVLGWTDAGFATADTKSQNGLIITWGGTIIVWRSSRQSVSTLSTAEAELVAASLGWQILEGLRLLLADFGVEIPTITVLVDNQAAITITTCGSQWKTRYFGVRGNRLHDECVIGRARLIHCPTKIMLADALTKLAATPVIEVLLDAMKGKLPNVGDSGDAGRPDHANSDNFQHSHSKRVTFDVEHAHYIPFDYDYDCDNSPDCDNAAWNCDCSEHVQYENTPN